MQKTAAVAFAVCLISFSLSSTSRSQTTQTSPPVKDLLAVRPTDRVFKPIDDTERVTLAGHLHPMAREEFSTGPLSPEKRMEHIVLVLRGNPDQEAALDELTRAQQDPGSPYYHKWLTPSQFATRFGASANDIKQVNQWLQIHGMEIEDTPSNRAIVFSGNAGQVESTFHTTMRTYAVNGEAHYANATDPEIPEALFQVVHGVMSLHDFLSTPMHSVHSAFTSGGGHYLMPQDWATIYDVTPLYNRSITGSGQSIAVLGRVDILLSDVRTFRTNAALPANDPLFVINGADPGGLGSGDEVESALDVEWAGAIAKNATVKFITSKSGSSDGISLSAQYAVAHNVAPIITLSYGLCEMWEGSGGNAFWNSLWQQAAAQGQSVFVSSGDSGAAGCDSSSASTGTNGKGVNGLCSSPYSTCVGGTEFNEGSNSSQYWTSTNGSGMSSVLSYIPETTWNESGSGGGLWGSGGGTSITYAKPSWQSAPGVPADGKRDVPDVSMSAAIHDSYVIEISGQMMAVGGTSAAAPSLASAMALLLQSAGAAQGNINPTLYQLGTRQLSGGGAAVFHDITTGNNSVPGVAGFSAGTGYDEATGLGSIDANLLVSNWNSSSATFGVTAASSTLSVAKGSSATVQLTLTTSGGFTSPVTLSASGAATGVTVAFSSTTLTASAPVTATISAASSAAAATSTITITGTSAGMTHTAQIAVAVVAPAFTLTPSTTSSTLTAGTPATLTFTTALQNSFSAAVALTISGLPTGVTAAFSPASIAAPGSGSSTLTLTGSASTAVAGNTTLTVTATGGGVTKTQAISLTVVVPSFTLATSATTGTVVPGSTKTFTLTTSVVSGFHSAVALSASGLPKGVTAAFSPATIASPGSGSSTLTLTAASSATAESGNLTVTATGAGVTKTQALALTVVVPTINLTANATTANVVAGKTATFTLTTAVQNLSAALALSVAGLPSGVTAAFSPASISSPGNGSSTLTLTAASSAAAVNGSLTVTATGGGVTKTLALAVNVVVPTINLTANATSANLVPGKTATFTLTTAVQNLSTAVAMSVTGLPTRVTAAFSPASISSPGNGNSTLTLTAGSNATLGTAKLTVTATGGGVTKTLALNLTLAASSAKSATAPATATLTVGSSTQINLSPATLSGFHTTIGLSVTGLPKGVTGKFSPASLPANGTSGSTLTLSAASSASAGTSNLTITASGGGVTKTQPLSLTVTR